MKRSPEERRRERQEAKQRRRERFPDLFEKSEVKPSEDARHRMRRSDSSIASFSEKTWAANKGKTLYSTFQAKEGAAKLTSTTTFRRRSKPWKSSPAKVERFGIRARSVLKKVGERAKRVAGADSTWRKAVRAHWGTCLITGATEGLQAHHAYTKQSHPEWRHARWNGLLFHGKIHDLVHSTPGGMEAGQRVADEVEAAEAGRRLPVTRAEARQILFDHCPKLRQYARPE